MAEFIDNRENDLEYVRSRCEVYQSINADLSKKVQELKVMSSNFQAEMAILRNINLTEQGRVYQFQRSLLEVREQGKRFIYDFEKTMADVIAKTGIQIEEEDETIDPLQFRPPSRIKGYVPSEPVDQYVLNTVFEENEEDTSSQNSFAPCDDVVSSTPLLQPIPTGGRKGRTVLGDIKNSISQQSGPSQKNSKTAALRSKTPTVSDIPELLPLETPQRANMPNGARKLSNEMHSGAGYDSTQQSSLLTNIATSKTVVEVHEAPSVASEQTVDTVHVTERTKKSAKASKDPENVSSASTGQSKKTDKTMNSTVNTTGVTNRTAGTSQLMAAISTNATKSDSIVPDQSSAAAEKEEEAPPMISQRRRRNIAASSSTIQQNVNQSENEAASSSSKSRKSTKKLQSSAETDGVEESSDSEWEPYDDQQPNEKYNRPCRVNLRNTTVSDSQVKKFEEMQDLSNVASPKKKPEQAEKRMERKRKSPEEERPAAKSGASKKKRMIIESDDEDEEVEPPAPVKTPMATRKSSKKTTKKRKSIETLIRTSNSFSKKRRSSGSNQKKKSKVSKSADLNASNASSESASGRPSRRCRPTSLREPSLMKKMRR